MPWIIWTFAALLAGVPAATGAAVPRVSVTTPADSTPTCVEDLDGLNLRLQADYAGFLLEVDGARRAAFDRMFATQRALFDAHVGRVYGLAYRITRDEDLAQDCTQETFVRAFEQLGKFRGDAALSTWLHAVAASVALNLVRKVKRLRARETELVAAESVPADRRRAEPDLKQRLREAIERLPDKYRLVFVMHDVEGYTHEEIGAALGVRTGTSKIHLFRARAKLRDAMAAFAGEWAL
jgi:RNA polymerase sigma-70 factor, ECF subfamily